MAAPTFEDLVKRYGEKTAKWVWGMTHQTPAAIAAGEASTAAAGGLGAYTGAGAGQLAGAQATYGVGAAGMGTAGASGLTAAEAGAASGGSSLGGLGATGYTAGSVASLAAPLVMAYLQYQAGSGVNEPLRKKYETAGLGKMLSDMATGKKIDPNTTRETYGIKPKLLGDYFEPNPLARGEGGPGFETVDPRGYTPLELYEGMHSYGSGHSQTGGVGNSGYNDQQIDDMFGPNKDKVATLVGYSNGLPDWRNKRWDDPGTVLSSEPRLAQQRTLSNQYAGMSENDKADLMGRNPYNWESSGGAGPDEQWFKDQLWKEKEQAEIEKLLGYKLR